MLKLMDVNAAPVRGEIFGTFHLKLLQQSRLVVGNDQDDVGRARWLIDSNSDRRGDPAHAFGDGRRLSRRQAGDRRADG